MRRVTVPTLLLTLLFTLNPGIVLLADAAPDEATVNSWAQPLTATQDVLGLPAELDGLELHFAELPVRDAAGVAAVTWTGEAPEAVFLRQVGGDDVRTWTEVDADAAASTSIGRSGTDAFVVADAERIQAVAVSRSAIDATLTLYASPEPEQRTVTIGVATANAATGDYAWSNPQIRSRSSWGADEGLVRYAYTYAAVTGAMIHHTAGSNTYGEADVPGILRSIQSYHVNGRGWNDIAYNILVDKFGRAWEGRGGGVNKAVQGGHAYGLTNARVTGISLLGNYDTATPTAAMLDTAERVIAWKFAIHGVDPTKSTYGSGGQDGGSTYLPAISGHRDENATACPGINVYNQFATIRRKVAEYLPLYENPTPTPKPTATATPKPTATATPKPTATFADVPTSMAFYADIEWMAKQGISTGWLEANGTRTYRPAQPVARDAMAAFLYRAAGSPAFTPPATSPFADFPAGTLFYKEVAWMHAKGISTGWLEANGTRTYRPAQPVARDAMAAFLYRAAGSPAFTPPATSPFADFPAGTLFYKEVAWMHARGISTGWLEANGTRTYRPALPVTRDAMAAFIHRTPWG